MGRWVETGCWLTVLIWSLFDLWEGDSSGFLEASRNLLNLQTVFYSPTSNMFHLNNLSFKSCSGHPPRFLHALDSGKCIYQSQSPSVTLKHLPRPSSTSLDTWQCKAPCRPDRARMVLECFIRRSWCWAGWRGQREVHPGRWGKWSGVGECQGCLRTELVLGQDQPVHQWRVAVPKRIQGSGTCRPGLFCPEAFVQLLLGSHRHERDPVSLYDFFFFFLKVFDFI